ncbi:hypothetical protein QOZ80_7BG0594900 [Eleusine coracana subsp. coracana]|nr:hypothetical protein QOZ80_7BG0594900 [Eleusine coracana subsp. coracana]
MEGWAAAAACTAAALASAAGATAVALRLVHRHLLHYAEPTHQRFIVRIILMVLVYAVMSFLSLVSPHNAIYFNSIREIYDAWVIYNFFSLCLAWVGGPGTVVVSLSGQYLKPSWFQMTCCLPAIPLDGCFIRRCKQGCLQFVILKPILVVITFVLYAKGKYEDGNFSVNQSYLYITIIYTISYSMALFALALFYAACRDLLQPYNPVPKFIMIKSVVFLTYWQGVLVFLAAKSGFIKNAEKAAYLQNFVLWLISRTLGSLLHALKFSDFYHDTVHQFAPTYHEYVLYSNEAEDEPTKYSPSTIVPTGEHIELAEVTIVSSKAPMMSSLSPYGADQAETVPSQVRTGPSVEPYDLSKLLNVD